MAVILKRIKREEYDSLIEATIETFKKTGEISFSLESIENSSELILSGADRIEIDFDLDKYNSIVNDSSLRGYDKLSEVGMLLHRDISSSATSIPYNVCYEKEMWAYLSLTAFLPVVLKLRLDDESKINEEKIKRFIFNSGTISRTGLFFLWAMVDRLGSENDSKLTHTAFEFIDPVKAIFERSLSKSNLVLRAFVQGIINNKSDSRFKNDIYRVKVPNNISCFAGVSLLDAYSYEELVDTITQQQKEIINSKV